MENKLYYTIGEVAEILSTSTSQLRYWSGEFSLNVRKNRKGDRLFQKVDLDKLTTIQRLLKEEGFTIDGAKKKLKSKTKLDQISDPVEEPHLEIETTVVSVNSASEILYKLRNIRYQLEKLKVEIDQNF